MLGPVGGCGWLRLAGGQTRMVAAVRRSPSGPDPFPQAIYSSGSTRDRIEVSTAECAVPECPAMTDEPPVR